MIAISLKRNYHLIWLISYESYDFSLYFTYKCFCPKFAVWYGPTYTFKIIYWDEDKLFLVYSGSLIRIDDIHRADHLSKILIFGGFRPYNLCVMTHNGLFSRIIFPIITPLRLYRQYNGFPREIEHVTVSWTRDDENSI